MIDAPLRGTGDEPGTATGTSTVAEPPSRGRFGPVVLLNRRPLILAIIAGLVLAEAACLLTGLSPALPFVLAGLAIAAARPMLGLGYVLIVLTTPLGLWMAGVQGLVGDAFGDRDYALNLSAAAVTGVLFLTTAWRHPWTRRQLAIAAGSALALTAWILIGIAHHGVGQTLVGVRLMLIPVLLAAVLLARHHRQLARLITLLAWVAVANAVAAVVEYVIGPDQLVVWGFQVDVAVRIIGNTFRAPGLTNFNAELGMLAGSYLLAYLAMWLTADTRPRYRTWHAGAVAAAICLVLSTSRSGALLVVGGIVAAIVLNRSGSPAARRRSRLLGGLLVAGVAAGFAVLGAVGAASLLDRLDAWKALLGDDLPGYGLGIGAVGAATFSRTATGPQIAVDNYYASLALQFGPVVAVAVVAAVGYGLYRLSRITARRPAAVAGLAVLAGLALASLVIETWEYTSAMATLAVFLAYAHRRAAPAAD